METEAGMNFNSPLSLAKANHLVEILDLPPVSSVVEIGCGNGLLLNKIIKYYNAFGLGIDLDAELIRKAQAHALSVIDSDLFDYRVADVSAEELPHEHFDLAICNGSSHAYGRGEVAYENMLKTLVNVIKSGGCLLVGEAYWKKSPEKEYLEFIGAPTGVYNSFEENIAYAEKLGLTTLYATSSNQDEWDNFEWSHKLNINKLLSQHPEDKNLQLKKESINSWIKGYLKWGRNTMGYGFYLFTKQ